MVPGSAGMVVGVAEPLDHILALSAQLRADMTTLANVTAKVSVNGGADTTYTNVSTPAITQNANLTYAYKVNIPANTYSDGDVVAVVWLYSAVGYAYDTYTIGPASVDGAHYTNTRGDNLANLDAAVSTRSTYAGADTSGTTTLLTRIASALTITGGKVDVNDKTDFALTSAYDPAKTAAQAGDAMALTSGERTTLTAAMWNALTSGLTAVGSIGKLLATNIDATISSRYADNGDVAAIKAKTDLLGSAAVTVVAPVLASGNISLVQGDDYKASDGRALLFNSTSWPSLTGAGIALKVRKTSGGVSTTTFSGTALSGSSVQVELSGSQSASLSEGEHSYNLVATLSTSSDIVTLGSGVCFVQRLP